MIRTIIQNGFDADYRISSQRAFLYGFLDTFFNSREVVLRNGAADNFLLENVWFLGSPKRRSAFYMTVLAVAAGLFLYFASTSEFCGSSRGRLPSDGTALLLL